MERYFIVTDELLIEQLKEYEIMRKKVDETFKAFKEEVGIETCQYYQHTDRLAIVPTAQDSVKFSQMLKVDGVTFKKNSSLSKMWVKICKEKELKTPRKPVWELESLIDGNVYRFRSRLFSFKDKVYGSFESDEDFTLPSEHFIELKASEFYKIVEDCTGV